MAIDNFHAIQCVCWVVMISYDRNQVLANFINNYMLKMCLQVLNFNKKKK